METVSPSAARIGAALRALRQTQDAGDVTSLGVECLRVVIAQLAEEGISPEDLQPLADLEVYLGGPKQSERSQPKMPRDRRHASAPSSALLARAAAMIDLLVKGGQDEAEAAQTVMRRLVVAGVPPPTQGGDARGWRRLLEQRNKLLHGAGPEDAKHEYQAFAAELEAIPAGERVRRVLGDRLWDRRRRPR
jgi:hypothetical protein